MRTRNTVFLYSLLIMSIPLIYLCGRFVFESIWYRQEQLSPRTMWFGASGNELFITQNISRRYVAWWMWEASNSSFYDDEVWLYKYDLKSKKCLLRKNVGVKSRYWTYMDCFIVGNDKIFLVRSGKNKHCEETMVYDLNTLKQINVLNYKTGPVLTFGSQAYKEYSFTRSGEPSYIHWADNGKDTFVRDDDIQYMRENNIDKVDSKNYDPEKVPSGGVAGTYTELYYNNKYELRKVITEITNNDTYRYLLLDGINDIVLDSFEEPSIPGGNFHVCDDNLYSVYLSKDEQSFHFIRRNFLSHKTEKIELPCK